MASVAQNTTSSFGEKFGPTGPTRKADHHRGRYPGFSWDPRSSSWVQLVIPTDAESPDLVRPDYRCVYKIYFMSCGLTFLIPKFLFKVLKYWNDVPTNVSELRSTRYWVFVRACEENISFSVPQLLKICLAKSNSGYEGTFYFSLWGYWKDSEQGEKYFSLKCLRHR